MAILIRSAIAEAISVDNNKVSFLTVTLAMSAVDENLLNTLSNLTFSCVTLVSRACSITDDTHKNLSLYKLYRQACYESKFSVLKTHLLVHPDQSTISEISVEGIAFKTFGHLNLVIKYVTIHVRIK